MNVNIPEIVADLKSAFGRYEKALNDNDVGVLNEMFWNSPHTICSNILAGSIHRR